MATTKRKKPDPEELATLKSDVASFASSLGLAPPSTSPSAGFDDSDFRKSGPLKPPATPKIPAVSPAHKKKGSGPEAKPRPHPLQVESFPPSHSKAGTFPNLPLTKPSSLSGHWYIDAEELERRVVGGDANRVAAVSGMEELKRLVEKKREVAEGLMEQYTREYEARRRKSGDMRLLEVTARSGTSADKVAAFTCLVEDNPIANMRSLDALLSMVTSKVGKRYAFTGFEALKELFLLRLLPDRKLKCLLQHPLDNLPESKDGFSLLLFWYWEECLKQRYERFIIALEEALKDMLPNLKDKAMKTVYILLRSKSEQERRLLTALVNKLGDPERKAASSAGYHLSCLLSTHPNMKAVVIDEVDSFIFRPHIGLRAKYQAVNFLSQILLTKKGDGSKIAKRLVDVYFALFKVLIAEASDGKRMHQSSKSDRKNSIKRKEKGEEDKKKTNSFQKSKEEPSCLESHVGMDSRLLSVLLTGVNRAFPFVASDEADDIIEVQTPILFKLVHSENFNVGVQALMLLYQISSKNKIVSDRFYRALYSKLLIPAAVHSSKSEMFLGLLVKAMKNDITLKRVSAFSKRLLQVALQRPPQYACGCLFLLSEVLKAKPPLWTMLLQNESVDDELEHFEDIKEEPENVPGNSSARNSGNSLGFPASQNCEVLPASHLEDIYNSEGEGSDQRVRPEPVVGACTEQSQSSCVGSSLPAGYNPRHREPLYCNADRTGWWELTMLATHVHPSVATMAQTLLSGANIVYNGDPLNDLALNAFLDKFMEKKPKPNRKAEGSWHGGSQIAPSRKLDMNHHLIGNEILQLAEEEVPPEDVVFHRFYMNKASSSRKQKAKKRSTEDDETAEELLANASDESEEEEIDSMLGSGHLMLDEAEGEYDYDDLDRVADEDDDDLLGNGSDADTGPPTKSTQLKHDRDNASVDGDDGSIDIWDGEGEGSDDISDGGGGDESAKAKNDKKRKFEGISRGSPFASLEDYEHLMNDDRTTGQTYKSRKSNKKKKSK